jgi:hypothetical protein
MLSGGCVTSPLMPQSLSEAGLFSTCLSYTIFESGSVRLRFSRYHTKHFSGSGFNGVCGSGKGRQKTHKNVKKFFYFNVLDVLFG